MTIMAALGPKARALVQAGRTALRPAQGDRERIEAALRAELGPAALPPQASVPPPPVAATAGWQAVAGKVLLGVGLIGGAAYLALSPARNSSPQAGFSERPSTPVAAPSLAPSEPLGSPVALDVAAAPAVAAPPVLALSEQPAAPAPSGRDRLAEEVALLSRATKALRAGRAGEALKALDEHQSRFPRGALSEERRAAKAEALCSLGRMSEGRAELGRLAPQSPAAARAKQVCDSGSSSNAASPHEGSHR
jgi:hypothetical protein